MMMKMMMEMMVVMILMLMMMLGNHKCGKWQGLANTDVILSQIWRTDNFHSIFTFYRQKSHLKDENFTLHWKIMKFPFLRAISRFPFSSSKISRLKSKEIQPRISFPEQSQGDPGFSQTKVRRLKDFQDFSGAKSGGPRRSKMFFRAKSGGSRRSRIFSRAKSKVQGDSGFWDQVLNLTTYI